MKQDPTRTIDVGLGPEEVTGRGFLWWIHTAGPNRLRQQGNGYAQQLRDLSCTPESHRLNSNWVLLPSAAYGAVIYPNLLDG